MGFMGEVQAKSEAASLHPLSFEDAIKTLIRANPDRISSPKKCDQPKKSKETPESDKPPRQDSTNTVSTNPLKEPPSVTEKALVHTENSHCQKQESESPTNKRIARWSAVVGIAAIFQVLTAASQWWIMEKTLKITQRAYIGIEKIEAHFGQKGIIVWFQNAGNIPADKIRLHLTEDRFSESHPEKRIGGNVIDVDLGHNPILKGTSSYPVTIPLANFNPSEISDIISGSEQLLISGGIRYFDGFADQEASFSYKYFATPQKEIWIPMPVVTFDEMMKYGPPQQENKLTNPIAHLAVGLLSKR